MLSFHRQKLSHLSHQPKVRADLSVSVLQLARPLLFLGSVAFLVLLFLVFFSSPYQDNNLTVVNWERVGIFLFVLLIFSYCLFSLFVFFVKVLLLNPYDKNFTLKNSRRQGLLLSFGLVVLAIMLSTKTLNIFTLALEIVLIAAIEVSFH